MLVISNLLTGDETWVHMSEPQRRADNKQWKRKDQKCPCIGVPRLTETKPKYRNETEIPKRSIKSIGKESNLHLWHWFLVLFWYS